MIQFVVINGRVFVEYQCTVKASDITVNKTDQDVKIGGHVAIDGVTPTYVDELNNRIRSLQESGERLERYIRGTASSEDLTAIANEGGNFSLDSLIPPWTKDKDTQ